MLVTVMPLFAPREKMLYPEMSLNCFVAHVVEVKRDFYENMLIAYAPFALDASNASNAKILNKTQIQEIQELQCLVEDVIKIHRKLCIDPEDVHFIEQLLDACEKVVNPTLSQDENPVSDEISTALNQKIVSGCKYVIEMYELFGYIDPEPATTCSICFLRHICQEVVNST
jgi:hypothetical protein